MLAVFSIFGFLAIGVLAQSGTSSAASAQTTVNLFVGSDQGEGFVGSVISADSCATTYAIACTSGSYSLQSTSGPCNPQSSATITYRPSSYEISTHRMLDGASVTFVENCSISGTTKAVCTASAAASAQGTESSSSTTRTLSGTQLNYHQVPITAGASMLSNQATCTSSGNAAAATGISEVYKILIVPGAAALIGALA